MSSKFRSMAVKCLFVCLFVRVWTSSILKKSKPEKVITSRKHRYCAVVKLHNLPRDNFE